MTKRTCSLFAVGAALSLLGCNRDADREPMTPASGTTLSGSESLGDGRTQSGTDFMGTDGDATRPGNPGPSKGTTGASSGDSSTDPTGAGTGMTGSGSKHSDTPTPSSGTTGHGPP
jgi:hypothetical protein